MRGIGTRDKRLGWEDSMSRIRPLVLIPLLGSLVAVPVRARPFSRLVP
jgi:hypothetical protein